MPTLEKTEEVEKAVRKWRPEVVFEAYELAKSGLPETQIAAVLGLSRGTYAAWKKKRVVFAKAVGCGRAARLKAEANVAAPASGAVWEDALGRLPGKLRKVWRAVARLNKEEEVEKSPTGRKVSRLVSRFGDKVRQQLYVHALFRSNFNRTEACRKLNLPVSRVIAWERDDPDFVRLLLAVRDAKKDLFESKLVEAVARGETAAVLFANRTLNRDRGYSDKTEVEHTHEHTVAFDQLPLDLETRKKVLEAYRAATVKALPAADASLGVIDAEVLNVLKGGE